VSPFEEVGFGHGDEAEQTRALTLSPAAPVFATQPQTLLSVALEEFGSLSGLTTLHVRKPDGS